MDDDHYTDEQHEAQIERREDRAVEKQAVLDDFDFERDCGERQEA